MRIEVRKLCEEIKQVLGGRRGPKFASDFDPLFKAVDSSESYDIGPLLDAFPGEVL